MGLDLGPHQLRGPHSGRHLPQHALVCSLAGHTPNVFLLGVATFSLITAPGLLGLLVAVFTPSRVASWLARHFTLALIIYAMFLLGYAMFVLGLQGTGVLPSGRR